MGEQNDQLVPVPISRYRIVIASMVAVFMFYNFVIYTSDCENPLPPMNEQAMRGEILWQKSNCTSCHQLYGLGGYLGPDLTNVISRSGKGPEYVKAFINSGVKAMPRFNFSDREKDEIVAFLTHVDKTGYFPNPTIHLQKTGWVKLEYKSSKTLEDE